MSTTQRHTAWLTPTNIVISIAALAKFLLHLYTAPGYGFFGDELYTIAMSKHLAWGYVDLPPLVPALVAISRTLLGESLLAMHIFPALAGAATLVLVCLITKAFGGKTFAIGLSGLAFIVTPVWMIIDSIFCYDSIDQLVLAAFLYTLIRLLKTEDRKIWLLLGLIAGLACLTKMTILILGPGFLVALLLSKHRKDLLTPWPWLGGVICAAMVSPYILWQIVNHWPTLEYWRAYGTARLYQASIPEYANNLLIYMSPLVMPLWLAGLYRIFRRMGDTSYAFLGVLFLSTLVVMFQLHAAVRMLSELFIPLLAAGAIFWEEILANIRWRKGLQAAAIVYLLLCGITAAPFSLPIVPTDTLPALVRKFSFMYTSLRDFNGAASYYPILLAGRVGWDELVQETAKVYHDLPAEERANAGIYADFYMPAGAIDLLGPKYGLPHAVSGSLTYYLWGPGYSWDVMLIIADRSNEVEIFFDECELKASMQGTNEMMIWHPNIYLCRKPKISAEKIWSSLKLFR
jgi:4-amino-4-deoxy-L-arabinose transferase-like glycosyltransferase